MRGAAARRVRALGVLTRLREQEIDLVTGELRRLQGLLEELQTERGRLEAGLAENAQVETLEGGFFLARYARDVRARIAGLDRRAAELNPQREALDARIRGLYQEAKTFESLEARIRTGALRERSRRETAALEEAHLLRSARRSAD